VHAPGFAAESRGTKRNNFRRASTFGSSAALERGRMQYVRLGRTGLKVSRLCLGTMMFGRWGNTDHDDCVRIVQRALDEGVNFIDTANRYCWGESEEIVGKAVRGKRNDVVLATKVFMPGPGGALDRGLSRRHPPPSRAGVKTWRAHPHRRRAAHQGPWCAGPAS
jgi:hypothetical protein